MPQRRRSKAGNEAKPESAPTTVQSTGTVRIAPEVLGAIAALTAQSVPGVVRLEGGLAAEVGKLVKRGKGVHGVKVSVVGGEVWVELHLVVLPDVSMYKLGREVQRSVTEALETMVGIPVHSVDVYIEDVA
jgi:uncharacterized alkaline shock family protein YloU